MKKVHVPLQWVGVAVAFLFAFIVAVQYQVLQNAETFKNCVNQNSTALAQHTNDTNNAIKQFINQSSKLSTEIAALTAKGAPQTDPRIVALRLKYVSEIQSFKADLHDTRAPECN